VIYFGPPPSHQLIISDIVGEQQHTLLNASNYLSFHFSRIKSSQDLLFSTVNSNYSNRWLKQGNLLNKVNNSTVYDTQPALAHNSPSYAFISTRSGQDQLYHGDFRTGENQIISQLNNHEEFNSLAFSPSDDYLLLTESAKFWILPVKPLLEGELAQHLQNSDVSFQTNGKLTQTRWLTNNLLYFKIKEDEKSKHYIFNRMNKRSLELSQRWSTLVTDHSQTDLLYLLSKHDSQMYKVPINALNFKPSVHKVTIDEQMIEPTSRFIPPNYIDLKIHQQKMHYIMTTDEINVFSNSFNLHVQSLSEKGEKSPDQIFEITCNCGYDVSDSGLMVSERISLEGDVHRTVNK